MSYSFNKENKNMINTEKNTSYYDQDDDSLVDYDESDYKNHKRISNQFQRYKNNLLIRRRPSFVLEYNKEGFIKCPDPSLISMDMIRSVILAQHCKIKKSDLKWFEEGICWLAQKQYQNTYPSSLVVDDLQEDLERSCEAYFDVPLSLCEDHWAAIYLLNQARRGLGFQRKLLQPSPQKRFSFKQLLQRLCCIPLVENKKTKNRSFNYGIEDCNENHWTI